MEANPGVYSLMKQPLEKHLLRRLKFLGIVLLSFAVIALFFERLPDFSDDVYLLEEEIEELPPLNSFLVSSVFGTIGALCFVIAWKKTKRLQREDSE